jgi:hypothetical protein
MSEANTNHQYIVSPIMDPGHHINLELSPRQANIHPSSDRSLVSHHKIAPSVTERSTGSTGWQPPATSKSKGGSHWWPWEWLCELLAIGSLGAMVFTLWYYQDRPQAEWRQSYFTLNGLVAFLATLTKTGLAIPVSAAIGQRKWLRFLPSGKGKERARRLGDFETFDEASRGSLGSAKLVISLNLWYDGWTFLFVVFADPKQGCRLLRSIHYNCLCLLQRHHTERSRHIRELKRRGNLRPPCWPSPSE